MSIWNNAIRELYYTNIINGISKNNSIVPCNIPIGFYQYSNDLKFLDEWLAKGNIIKNEIPKIIVQNEKNQEIEE